MKTFQIQRVVIGALAAALLGSIGLPSTALAAVPAPSDLSPNAPSPLVKDLELTWAPVAGALSYDVEVSDDAAFEGQVLSANTKIPYWTVPVQLPRAGYYWRVRANTVDGEGRWSTTAEFTRGWNRNVAPGNPHIVAPGGTLTAGATNADNHVTLPTAQLPAFTWRPIPGASFYELEISNRPLDSSYPPYSGTQDKYRFTCYTQHTWFSPYGVVKGESDAPGDMGKCGLVLTGEKPPEDGTIGTKYHLGVKYYWRVRGRDGTSDKRTTPFPQPALSCTGVWESSGGTINPPPAEGEPVDPDRPKFVYQIPSTPPTYRAHPECSQWAQGGTFEPTGGTVAEDVDATPNDLAAQPTAGSDAKAADVTLTSTPVLSWSATSNTLFYRVYLSRTSDFTDSDVVYETQATSLSPAHSFANRTAPTYWTVQACGVLGCGTPAAAKIFRKQSWNTVKTLPMRLTKGGTATFQWTPQYASEYHASSPAVPRDDQAMSYQLQVADETGNFAKPLVSVTVDHVGSQPGNATWRTPLKSLPEDYVWRVRAIDETGRAWAWANSAPYARISSASGFGLGAPLVVDFTAAVRGVTASSLKVLDASGRTVPVAIDELTDQRYHVVPTALWTAGQRYKIVVTTGVTDAHGRTVKVFPRVVRASTVVDSASAAMRKVDGTQPWRTVMASDAIGRSYLRATYTSGTRSAVSAKVVGSVLYVRGCKSPYGGYADIYVDGTRKARVNLYRSYSGCARVWRSGELPAKQHTVSIVVTGLKHAASKGKFVAVDSIRAL